MSLNLTAIYRIAILVFFAISMNAQDSLVVAEDFKISNELIEARDGIDYSDDVVEKKEKKKEEKDFSSPRNADFNFSDIAGLLLMLTLVALVFGIIYFMLGRENVFKPKSRKIKELNLESIEQIEENLEDHDVAYYLKQAIQDSQYRIAIRLHYLLIIKELSEKKFIKWKRDKTNRNYINETASYTFSEKFRESTSIFEKVWYGERNVVQKDFDIISAQFNSLTQEINNASL